MLRRAILVFLAIASLISLIGTQQQRSKRSRKSAQSRQRSRHKPAQPPVTSFVTDSGGRDIELKSLEALIAPLFDRQWAPHLTTFILDHGILSETGNDSTAVPAILCLYEICD